MMPLLPAQVLEARDQCAGLHPIDRALALLRIAAPGGDCDPSLWPIARRDRALFELRRAMFGDGMHCLVECPVCSDTQEFSLSAAEILESLGEPPGVEQFEGQACSVTLRPLDSRDLAAAARASTLDDATRILRDCAIVDGGTLTRSDLEAVEARIEAREAAADIAINLRCARCGHSWTDGFDIDAQLGREVETSADHLVRELAALASRFGWSERDMLAMPTSRRRAYLEALA